MTKKVLLVTAITAVMFVFAVPASAQLNKALKNAGKSVGKAVTDAAGDMAADVAANKVSLKIIDFMDNNNTLASEDSEYYKRLADLVSSKYVNVDDLFVTYRVYENAEANILATADGSIRVYTGMMDLLTDDELLAVISIQIGHLANKDVRDALLSVASEDNATKASSAQLEKLLSLSGERLGTVVNELMQIPYSEEQSKKADSFAFDLLKKNGTDTGALVSALRKFAALEDADKQAEIDESETSVAYKYIGVNSNNSVRASLISTK